MTIEESCQIAKLFEAEGVDYISVTGEGFGRMLSPMLYLPVDYFPYPEPDEFMKPYMKDFEGEGNAHSCCRGNKASGTCAGGMRGPPR